MERLIEAAEKLVDALRAFARKLSEIIALLEGTVFPPGEPELRVRVEHNTPYPAVRPETRPRNGFKRIYRCKKTV